MLYKGTILTEMSGSLGGITASHGRGGAYLRARVVPTDPNTAEQQAVKAIFAQLATLWRGTLDQDERDAWDVFAANTPVPNRIGEPRLLTGLNQYVRCNTPRLQASLDRVDTAPPLFGGANFTPVTVSNATEAGQTVDVNFTITDDWATIPDSGLILWLSRPQNPGINFFKGPYRIAGVEEGVDPGPPVTPATIAVPFAFVEDQKLFWRANATLANGLLGADMRGEVIAVA